MNSETIHRNDDALSRLLHADEESDEFRDLSRHVDNCPSCQVRLEQLAGAAGLWAEAKDALGSLSSQQGERNFRSSALIPRWERRPAAWTEAMARQLLSPPSHPEMLGRLGRYEVERLIGSGGMGIVFKAFDTELNRPVAIKVLAPYLAGSGAARKRFAREARAAAAVVHEHVVPIHNVESDGEAPFLVMHYVAGESLQQRLDREGPLELCEILRIALQTAAGLAAAHAQGLVHRDVKPSNILLEERVERALLTDFGLARAGDDASLTHTGYHPGTPQYMSPEQARGEAVDTRSDLFSLGSVMYVMCTGRLPFRAETTFGILRRITDTEPRPIREINPTIPEWLADIVNRSHAKCPEQRFQSASELHELLVGCLAHVQQPQTVPLPDGCQRRCRGSTFRLWIGAGTAAVLLIGAAWSGLFSGARRDSEVFRTVMPAPVGASASASAASHAEDESLRTFDPDTEWRGLDAEFEAIESDLQHLEKRTQQFWDRAPQSGFEGNGSR